MGNRIKELREEKSMSQLRLSTKLGVSQETISAYEKNKHHPKFSHLRTMTELFDASVDYIMGLSDIRFPVKESCLSNSEVALLALYRKLSPTQQEKSIAFIQGQLNA